QVLKKDDLGSEILRIALPAAMALAADPIASLIDTVFIGRLGPTEIAAVGVSIAIFNQASKVTIFPLVSITTSFVAEEDTFQRVADEAQRHDNLEKDSNEASKVGKFLTSDNVLENLENNAKKDTIPEDNNMVENLEKVTPINAVGKEETSPDDNMLEKMETGLPLNNERKDTNPHDATSGDESECTKVKQRKRKRHIPSASTALLVGSILGILQAIFLIFGAKALLKIMGVKSDSWMFKPALKYLTLRAIGSPAVLLSLAMQGIFRGFKDTKTPLYAIVIGDVTNIILDPIFIFSCRLGITGAAIAHVLSQYLIVLILLWALMKEVKLLPPSLKELQFSRFLRNGFLLLVRVIAATICVTLAASRAARLGTTPMAAFQICLQVWLTSSLLADGLAVAGQAIIACAFAEKDHEKATSAATRVLQMSCVLGIGLGVIVGLGLHFGGTIFSKDPSVLHFISMGIPFVAATQPINSLAFVFDGVNFGASDFAYASYSMVVVAIASIVAIFLLSKSGGYIGIWVALTIFMGLRTFAGLWRMGTGTGPWRFLRGRLLP
ncbi:hypothetical protein Tsubulata_002289, partial [Turnera subulata]